MLSSLIFLAILLTAAVQLISADFLEYHSFEPPYQDVDGSGIRQVSPHWRISGTTMVNNNFVRLTPDRQSKKGAIWSRKALSVPYFSSVLKFRISGQGKNFFGDGIGFWIVHQGYYTEGPIHGFSEKFVGIGIIFDTFKNTENLLSHRDVTVLVNDGTKTYEQMTADVKGCDTNVRYHADRADFSVNDASRAKIILNGTSLEVFVDAKNNNDFSNCVTLHNLNLPKDWLSKAYIGITATTGQLADNHDILYLKSFSNATKLDQDEEAEFSEPHFAFPEGITGDDKLKGVEEVLNKIINNHETLDHHVEHQFAAVMDHIKNLISKIEKREDRSETRIENLEQLIKREVEGTLSQRLTALEQQMNSGVERKMTNIESALDRKMNRLEVKATEVAQQSSTGWRLPFLILTIMMVGAAIGLYLFYLKMKKMHIL